MVCLLRLRTRTRSVYTVASTHSYISLSTVAEVWTYYHVHGSLGTISLAGILVLVDGAIQPAPPGDASQYDSY